MICFSFTQGCKTNLSARRGHLQERNAEESNRPRIVATRLAGEEISMSVHVTIELPDDTFTVPAHGP